MGVRNFSALPQKRSKIFRLFRPALIYMSNTFLETEKGQQTELCHNRGVIAEAVKAVSDKELSCSEATEKYGKPLHSLKRYYQLLQNFRQKEKLQQLKKLKNNCES
ncbi:hypothetical protein AVEN_2280-1 [Araneus ventricosus]|uniref:HTH psq-type domain-containing protein n=1 Tax=Araneus ventricosus TaxID=182803 RepID=A0A4Y2FU42_ARAVE|nr:hypothetical protein AVEN_2280-1 [Araneus ventricosus]